MLQQLIGPGQTVTVIPLGNDGTVGSPVTVTQNSKPVLIATGKFGSGSALLTVATRRVLDRVVGLVKSKGFRSVRVTGNTDNVGSKASARRLSKARGLAARNYLRSALGVGVKVSVTAQADRNPVASNASAAGRATNRRVDISVG